MATAVRFHLLLQMFSGNSSTSSNKSACKHRSASLFKSLTNPVITLQQPACAFMFALKIIKIKRQQIETSLKKTVNKNSLLIQHQSCRRENNYFTQTFPARLSPAVRVFAVGVTLLALLHTPRPSNRARRGPCSPCGGAQRSPMSQLTV